MISKIRIFEQNQKTTLPHRDFVLYWMIANRRLEWNFALQHAIEEANRLQKPLLIGADVVMYSATKHIDGQGRVLGGAILGSKKFCNQ